MKARILALLLALVMVASLFAACSAGKTGTPDASTGTSQTPDDSKTTEDTKPAKTEKTKIVYWHSYTDQHEEKFLELAAAFNASQDEYELVAEQQPYSEIDSKTMQAVRNGTGPDLVNMYPSDAVNYLNEGRLVDLSVYINDPRSASRTSRTTFLPVSTARSPSGATASTSSRAPRRARSCSTTRPCSTNMASRPRRPGQSSQNAVKSFTRRKASPASAPTPSWTPISASSCRPAAATSTRTATMPSTRPSPRKSSTGSQTL